MSDKDNKKTEESFFNGDNSTIEASEFTEIIKKKVEPYIYAFKAPEVESALKVGDTYRDVDTRLDEWRNSCYPNLQEVGRWPSKVKDEDVYFRDISVHRYLSRKNRERLQLNRELRIFSNEFFKYQDPEANDLLTDISQAITTISNDYRNPETEYEYYSVYRDETIRGIDIPYERNKNYPLRDNQEKVVNKFVGAVNNGRHNLLMYAVMRFGKTFTSLCCALKLSEIRQKPIFVVIVSGVESVRTEWKKTIEEHENFKDFIFYYSAEKLNNENVGLINAGINPIENHMLQGKSVAVFLTLQELNEEKRRHDQIFNYKGDVDLLIIDETHFAARGEKDGKVLQSREEISEIGFDNKEEAAPLSESDSTNIRTLKGDCTISLHLSGTPYRIMMGEEFKEEDIIAKVGYSDIIKAKNEWDEKNKNNIISSSFEEEEDGLADQQEKDKKIYHPWDNPYYGFPEMIRFGFDLNTSSLRKLESLKDYNIDYSLNEFFKPKSTRKNTTGNYKKFAYEDEVLDFLKAIDGSSYYDKNVLGFLDLDDIKNNKMCQHIVMVLPYRASCDAMEKLLKTIRENRNDTKYKGYFNNLCDYEIINIAGFDSPYTGESFKQEVTSKISNHDKTICLTVQKMLTGSTVPQWDTMIYLKNTASAQEYDQAIYRLQNPYVEELKAKDGSIIKINKKEQTILVDFDVNRIFNLTQESIEATSKFENNDEGRRQEIERLNENAELFPFYTVNARRLERVKGTDIMDFINKKRDGNSIIDEASATYLDEQMIDYDDIRSLIQNEYPLKSKKGLRVPASIHAGQNGHGEIEIPNAPDQNGRENLQVANAEQHPDEAKRNEDLEKLRNIYAKIYLYAFLTDNDNIRSLDDLIDAYNNNEGRNRDLCYNLGLVDENNKIKIVEAIRDYYKEKNPSGSDKVAYSIGYLNKLSHTEQDNINGNDENRVFTDKIEIALKKFSKLDDAIVLTPSEICTNMVNIIPDNAFYNNDGSLKEDIKILDIASTSGEYTPAIVKKMKELGYSDEIISDSIITIPKNALCYELTRKLYLLSEPQLNVDNIATFSGFELVNLLKKSESKNKYDKVSDFFKCSNEPICNIKINDIQNALKKRKKS